MVNERDNVVSQVCKPRCSKLKSTCKVPRASRRSVSMACVSNGQYRNIYPQTPAEATLWRTLRGSNRGYKFRRQHPIGRFIVDFYCAKAKLCIEIDSSTHFESAQMEYDAARTAWLEEVNCKVIRFTNDDFRYHINAIVDNIIQIIEAILVSSS